MAEWKIFLIDTCSNGVQYTLCFMVRKYYMQSRFVQIDGTGREECTEKYTGNIAAQLLLHMGNTAKMCVNKSTEKRYMKITKQTRFCTPTIC